jgi:hypothetical protein
MEIEVEAITLDSYVAENRIGQVNFIRSFTEYAEKYIFDGSCSGETLNAFKPKLSYVKGYPENASLLRNRLEERGYRVIMQKWQSFAWVPGIKEAH